MTDFSLPRKLREVSDEMDLLVPIRQSSTPEGLAKVVSLLRSFAVYDWSALDATLFPNGLITDIDMLNPAVAQAWYDLRQNQEDVLTQAYQSYTPGTDFYFAMPGFEVAVVADRMADVDHEIFRADEVVTIMGKLGWGIIATFDPFPRLDFLTRQYTERTFSEFTAASISTQLYSLWTDSLPSTIQFDPAQGVGGDTVRNFKEFLEEARDTSWANVMGMCRDQWKRLQARDAAVNAPAVVKRELSEFIRESIERSRALQSNATSLDDWNALPILGMRAKQAKSSRDWGIEIEVIDAADVIVPPSFKRERDHSLREQIGDGKKYDPWEFVSDILDTTFSDPLWMLCDQTRNTVKYYKAGVHVHVSAKRNADGQYMTTAEVSRLLELYALLSSLLDPVLQRRSKEFCVPIKYEQWARGWFVQSGSAKRGRVRAKQEPMAVDNAAAWAEITHGPNHDSEQTNWKRHQEVNLQALNKYGTIEFRSMGAVYDYEYLTRWAWFLRELVNYAQSDLPLDPFRKVSTLGQALNLLKATAVEQLSTPTIKVKKTTSKKKPATVLASV